MKKWLGFFSILLVGAFLWIKFHKGEGPKFLETKTKVPQETQFFCMSIENGIPAAAIRLDWKLKTLALWSFTNTPPTTTKDLITITPDLEGQFTKRENLLNFQNSKNEEDSLTLLDFVATNNLPQTVQLGGKNFTLKECPWDPSSEVGKIREQFNQEKISILCYTDQIYLTSSVYVLDLLNGNYKVWGTDQLSGWDLFTQRHSEEGTLINQKNSLAFKDALEKVSTWSISKGSKNQILELKADKLTFSQDFCPFLSPKFASLMQNKEFLYCLKPKILEPVPKDTKDQIGIASNTQETLSSVLYLDLKNKSFLFYGSFSGNKTELLQPPTAEGTITQDGNNLKFYSKEGKIIYEGTLKNNVLNIGPLEFKAEFCPF